MHRLCVRYSHPAVNGYNANDEHSVNICALTRVIYSGLSLTNKSIDDPTWDEPWAVSSVVLESNLAAVCASVPVFWGPMREAVTEKWNKIFVTQEVSVVRTTRFNDYRGSGTAEDERDLNRRASGNSQSISTDGGMDLDTFSTSEQQPNTSAYYKDEFVQAYVNPLHENRGLGNTSIQGNPRRSKKASDV